MQDDLNRVMQDRRRKLDELREAGVNPFANGFAPTKTCLAVLEDAETEAPPDMNAIPDDAPTVRVAGRIMAKNKMGKATFMRVRDRSVGTGGDAPEALQIYLKKDVLGEDLYLRMRGLDLGDIVGVEGPVFQTRTGETTVMVQRAQLLTKSLRPLPEKFHGLSDMETRYRQRYVDLVANPDVKQTFRARSEIIRFIREYLQSREFVEVETPILHPIPGGATARPFKTHHNALDMELYMRVAPELYLKRLVVGGLERVFEIGRNFRNEGLSTRHNPEFTMLEFYQAYATYEDLIALTEDLFSGLASHLNGPGGGTKRPYGEHVIDYAKPFARFTIREALTTIGGLGRDVVGDEAELRAHLMTIAKQRGDDALLDAATAAPYGKLLMEAFEIHVEDKLIQPTFITEFPIEDSPLARRNEQDPAYVDRFEIFVAGQEIANAFSELNDPIDQRERFEAQVAARDAGDDEAMYMDLDYLRALEIGMPPAAGEGIGIDRLVMLMTGQESIREVIYFPHMRPE